MKLSKLFDHPYLQATLSYKKDLEEINIIGISANSLHVKPGFLFVAKKGALKNSLDGHDYINDAISRGAQAIVIDESYESYELRVPLIRAKDSCKAFAYLCESFYEWPSNKISVIGITGTNGKTSTTFMLHSIFKAAGFKPAVMGTLGIGEPGQLEALSHTTAEALVLSSSLHKLQEAGFTHVFMEVSSHALSQNRADAINFAAVAFTNLSQDHLDFHGSMDNYKKAKERLFFELAGAATPKILANDHDLDRRIDSLDTTVLYDPKSELPNSLPFVGEFHIKNSRLAMHVARALDISDECIAMGLKNCPEISGRMEAIYKKGPKVFVDFAHTPEALLIILRELKKVSSGKLIVVFGCGGDRDQLKRPLMGQIASMLADILIITDDNPRSEDPSLIRAAIMAGINNGCVVEEIADRKLAIRRAIEQAKVIDCVLIAGKGHEQHQTFKDRTIPFSDQDEARYAVEQLCKA